MECLMENGISPKAVNSFIKQIKKNHIDLHSFCIYRNGKTVFSLYAHPFHENSMHRMYSSAKMLVALAVMKAVEEHLLNLDDKVIPFFDEELPEDIDDKYKELTIRHMLTMNTGHRHDTMEIMRKSDDWIKGFFDQPLSEMPGTLFFYNGGVPYILSKIVQKVTGMDFIEFLNKKFFDEMDIKIVADKVQCGDSDPSEISIRIKDFEKLAVLLLNQGKWNQKQLIGRDYINEMGKYHTSSIQIKEVENVSLDTKYGYGYFLWRNSIGGYRLDGGRGQYGIVIPDLNMCVSIMASEEDQGIIPEIFWKEVYPYIWSSKAPEQTRVDKIERYKALPLWHEIYSDLNDVTCCEYVFEDNDLKLEKVRFEIDTHTIIAYITQDKKEVKINAGADNTERINKEFIEIPETAWFLNHISGNEDHNYYIVGKYVLAADFTHNKEIILFVRNMERTTYTVLNFRFANDAIRLEVSDGAWNCMKMRGRLEIPSHIPVPIMIIGKKNKLYS